MPGDSEASLRAKWSAQVQANYQKSIEKQEERRIAQEAARTKVASVHRRILEEKARRQSQETARRKVLELRAKYPSCKGEEVRATPPNGTTTEDYRSADENAKPRSINKADAETKRKRCGNEADAETSAKSGSPGYPNW